MVTSYEVKKDVIGLFFDNSHLWVIEYVEHLENLYLSPFVSVDIGLKFDGNRIKCKIFDQGFRRCENAGINK